MGYITEFAAFSLRYRRRRGPRTPLGVLLFFLTMAAIFLAKDDDFHAKVFENETLRRILKGTLYLVAAILFVTTVAVEVKADN